MEYFAHSLAGRPLDEWHRLEDHLRTVSELAGDFAATFGARDWGRMAGFLHDEGKYSPQFQQMIRGSLPDAHCETKAGRIDHSTPGAKSASRRWPDGPGRLLAYVIAGHHAGLPDGASTEESCLTKRLERSSADFSSPASPIPTGEPADDSQLPSTIAESLSLPFPIPQENPGFRLSFFTRMLYSCLVDADFLDTERFVQPEKTDWRKGYPTLHHLDSLLMEHLRQLPSRVESNPVNAKRQEILQACLAAADWPPGFFSLTVPTGGGKTLSSLAFALRHALKHGLDRIIYVIPYTSIIEQNAAVFREILGDRAVLEHHCNFESTEEDMLSRLASENWDAPLVVTTSVQFFESLFAHRSSRCRKLHRIASSVVILDEAQMLPVELLRPCVEALRELTELYRTTVVFCTATQPALRANGTFPGLTGIREIVPDPPALYATMRRVKIHRLPALENDELAERLRSHKQVLCVVNTRRHARQLYEHLRETERARHLSALMCPAHRSRVLDEIRFALASNAPCWVVSTQLVEAGVDVDFPVVYRAMAGVDSIAQAAGRCNREGKAAEGEVLVFESAENPPPPGLLRQCAQEAAGVMRRHDDLLHPAAVEDYFQSLYWTKGRESLDKHRILASLEEGVRKLDFPFRRIGEEFRLIREDSRGVIIPWGEAGQKFIRELRSTLYPAQLLRSLQRYTVAVYPQEWAALNQAGALDLVHGQFAVLLRPELYSPELGLQVEGLSSWKAEDFVI